MSKISKEKINLKNKKHAQISTSKDRIAYYLRKLIFFSLLVVIFYPPFFRGLYFEKEQLRTEIFVFLIFAVFWVYKILKKDRRFLETPVEYASFALVIVYFISIFIAVNIRAAISEWLKYCMYFSVFFMLSELAESYRAKLDILCTIIASALGVCIIGLDGAAGGHFTAVLNALFKSLGAKQDVFFETFKNGRIFSSLQYPNALAAYLMAVYFVVLALIIISKKLWIKATAASACFIMLITFALTLSRGAYLIIPVAAVLFLIVLPRESRVKGVAYAFCSLIPTAIAFIILTELIANPAADSIKIWMTLLLGLSATTGLTILTHFIMKWLEKLDWKVYVIVFTSFIVVTALGTVYVLNATIPLNIFHSSDQEDSVVYERRSIILEPGSEYKLCFDVIAENINDKPYAFKIDISSSNIRELLSYKRLSIASLSEKSTQGTETKEISFKVPDDSRIIHIDFGSTYAGTSVEFSNAKIYDASGNKIKDVVLGYRYLPKVIASRMQNLQVSLSTISRSIFYKDALSIIKDHVLLGAGGGSWPYLYEVYQSYPYTSRQPHNYFLQVGVETGVLGLLVVFILLLYLVFTVIYGFRKKTAHNLETRVLFAGVAASIAGLFAHSAIDFDFSLSAVFLLFWYLLALFNSISKTDLMVDNNKMSVKYLLHRSIKINLAAGLIITVIITIIPMLFVVAAGHANKASFLFQKGELYTALEQYRKAIQADPFTAAYKINYANLAIRKEDLDQGMLDDANEKMKEAVKLSKNNVNMLPSIYSYYLSIGDIDTAVKFIDRITELKPFAQDSWQRRAEGYRQIAMHFFSKNDIDSAMHYVEMALNLIDKAKKVNENNLNPFVFNVSTQETIEKLKYVKDNLNVGKNINLDKIKFYSISDLDINNDGMHDQWSVSASDQIKLSVQDGNIRVENTFVRKSPYICSRDLELKPSKRYLVKVETTDVSAPETISFLVAGVMSNAEKLTRNNNIYTAEIVTPKEFDESKNYLLLYVDENYEFKSVLVYEK